MISLTLTWINRTNTNLDFQVSGQASGEASVKTIITKVRWKGTIWICTLYRHMSIYIYWRNCGRSVLTLPAQWIWVALILPFCANMSQFDDSCITQQLNCRIQRFLLFMPPHWWQLWSKALCVPVLFEHASVPFLWTSDGISSNLAQIPTWTQRLLTWTDCKWWVKGHYDLTKHSFGHNPRIHTFLIG